MIAKNRTQRNEFILCTLIVNIMLLHCAHHCFPFIVGERFERGIQDAVILESDEALVVVAQEEFDDIT